MFDVNSKKPLVSVVVPNYNHARFLNDRIESIARQTYDNYEIIILDDYSSDDSLKIIEKLRNNPKVSKIVINEENSGSPFRQWEKGIKESKGDVVWIAESDDSCDHTFLEKLVDFLVSNNLVMAFSLSRKMDSNCSLGEILQNGVYKNLVVSGSDYISNHINMICNASSAIFYRSCALKINNNYYEYKGTGDWLFWTGIASQGNVGVFAQPLNYYRIHENNTTLKMISDGRDFIELKQVFSYLLDEGYWSRWTYIINVVHTFYRIKYLYKFDNNLVKDELLKKWNDYPFLNVSFYLLLRGRNFIKKMTKL